MTSSPESFKKPIGLAAVFLATMLGSAPARSDGRADLRPAWTESYQVWSGRATVGNPNLSYLQNRNTRLMNRKDLVVGQIDSLVDRGSGLSWSQQYDDLNRDYEQRQRAGLSNPTLEQAHLGAVSGFSNSVLDEIEKRKLQTSGDQAAHLIDKDPIARSVFIPGGVVAGVWIGRTVNWRVTEDSHFSFRESLREQSGQIELHTPMIYGAFEFHPQAADSYNLVNSTGVDFGHIWDFNRLADFQAEKYQLRFMRYVPLVNMSSTVLYGSSSNVVASSLSKQLSPHWAAAVDSVYYLTPYEADHSLEERVRLRYDIHF